MPDIPIKDWPSYTPEDINRRDGAIQAAKLMMNAALTAPVTGGIAQTEGHLICGQREQEQIARKMEELAHQQPQLKQNFLLEAVMTRECDCILLIGNTRAHITPWDGECGACAGRQNCSYFYEGHPNVLGVVDVTDRRSDKFIPGPMCALYAHNTGYAIGSALMTAVRLLVDTRPLMTVGVAAQRLGYCPDSHLIVGLPVGVRGFSETRGPGPDYHLVNMARGVDALRKQVGQSGLRPAGGVDYRINQPHGSDDE